MTEYKLKAFANPFAFLPFKSSFLSCKFASFLGKTLVFKYKKRGLCTSVSHKICGKYIFVAVAFSQEPIGIDIEPLIPKNSALLQQFTEKEYRVLDIDTNSPDAPQNHKWNAFYTLWCAKEALIKKLNLTVDKRSDILPQTYKKSQKNSRADTLTLKFQNQIFKVKIKTVVCKNTPLILALAV